MYNYLVILIKLCDLHDGFHNSCTSIYWQLMFSLSWQQFSASYLFPKMLFVLVFQNHISVHRSEMSVLTTAAVKVWLGRYLTTRKRD